MADSGAAPAHIERRAQLESTGPYALRCMIDEVPLSTEGNETTIVITCVEFWGQWYEKWQFAIPDC